MYGCGPFRPEEKTLIFMSLMNGNIQLGILFKIKSKYKLRSIYIRKCIKQILRKVGHRECLKKTT